MNTHARGFRAAIWVALALIVSTSLAFAVDATEKSPAPMPEISEPNNRPAAITDAINLFAEGKDAAAVKRLRDSCWSAEGTPEFTTEYLAHFAYVAVALQECGKPQQAEKVAEKVLAEVDQARRSTERGRNKNHDKELLRRAAYVHARVLRDFETASSLLQEVAQLDPEDTEASKEAARAQENARQYGKIKKGGK